MKPEGEYQKVITLCCLIYRVVKLTWQQKVDLFEDVSPIENGDFNCRVSLAGAILFRYTSCFHVLSPGG